MFGHYVIVAVVALTVWRFRLKAILMKYPRFQCYLKQAEEDEKRGREANISNSAEGIVYQLIFVRVSTCQHGIEQTREDAIHAADRIDYESVMVLTVRMHSLIRSPSNGRGLMLNPPHPNLIMPFMVADRTRTSMTLLDHIFGFSLMA